MLFLVEREAIKCTNYMRKKTASTKDKAVYILLQKNRTSEIQLYSAGHLTLSNCL
jgi:hypothetical protein